LEKEQVGKLQLSKDGADNAQTAEDGTRDRPSSKDVYRECSIGRLGEAAIGIMAGREDLDLVTFALERDGRVHDETFRTPDTKVRMDETYTQSAWPVR
jgi:hypothetical protein